MTNAADVVRLDPSDPAFTTDRHTAYRRLRETSPIARTVVNGQDSWLLTGYADVEIALKSAKNTVQPHPGEFPAHLGTGPTAEFYRFSLPNVDAPAHTRLCELASPAFQPRTVKRMRVRVEEIIVRGLDELAERDDMVGFGRECAVKIPALIGAACCTRRCGRRAGSWTGCRVSTPCSARARSRPSSSRKPTRCRVSQHR